MVLRDNPGVQCGLYGPPGAGLPSLSYYNLYFSEWSPDYDRRREFILPTHLVGDILMTSPE